MEADHRVVGIKGLGCALQAGDETSYKRPRISFGQKQVRIDGIDKDLEIPSTRMSDLRRFERVPTGCSFPTKALPNTQVSRSTCGTCIFHE